MTQVTLGRTGLTVNKNGFGALPIQRVSRDEAAHLLQKALDNGIDFFDTARAYSDSEVKIGYPSASDRSMPGTSGGPRGHFSPPPRRWNGPLPG